MILTFQGTVAFHMQGNGPLDSPAIKRSKKVHKYFYVKMKKAIYKQKSL